MSVTFTQAAASYYGMPEGTTTALSGDDNGLMVQFTLMVSAEAVEGIAKRMQELRAAPTPVEPPEGAYKATPTLQEVMADPARFVGVAGAEDVLARACQLSSSVRTVVESEWARKVEDTRKAVDAQYTQAELCKHFGVPAPKTSLPQKDPRPEYNRTERARVQHGPDAGMENIPSPPLVWLSKADCTQAQRDCPVGVDDVRGRIAVYEDQLTDWQRLTLTTSPKNPS